MESKFRFVQNNSIMKTFFTFLFACLCLNTFSQNLILHYQLDGKLDDQSNNNNHASLFGTGTAPQFVKGVTTTPKDSAIQFNSGMGYKSRNVINNSTWSGICMSFWLKDCSTNGTVVQGAYNGFGASLDPSGKLHCFFDGSSSGSLFQTNTVNLNDGDWHHVICQNNGTSTSLYIDGKLDNSQSETKFKIVNNTSIAYVYLGITNRGVNNIDGKVDNIKIYSEALSKSQIDDLYKEGVNCSSTPFSKQPTDITAKTGDNVQFALTTSIPNPNFRWQMDIGAGFNNITNAAQYSGANSNTLTISNIGSANNNIKLRCLLTESARCTHYTDTVTLIVLDPSSVSENQQKTTRIYPNPTSGAATILLKENMTGTISVSDLSGQTVMTKSFSGNTSTIHLDQLKIKGLYFLNIKNDAGKTIITKRLIYH